ncbi:MAG: tRNA pseudouridine(38-40) synthase TruA [Ignavibacteriae bacterium HGW-Ignavibacteriae-3]|nr:MAG: tRNA pseudouridine(38-40) synthase TruA [Ignavibacteriae bacterium HGW-Ignavibacteriae-3]
MYNYIIDIQYDGTNYAGWQIQRNAPTVQQKIVDAIEVITKEKINLIGSGRTDSGVHALGQVANFRTEIEIDIYKFQYSLNSILPEDISVVKMKQADEKFHSRFDARSRSYLYLFNHNKSPFYYKYAYYYPPVTKINFKELNRISQSLLGVHDFSSLSKKNDEIDDKTCDISEIWWRKGKDISTFYITANRFLHGMVRTIVGTLLHAAENNFDEKYLMEVLDQKNREAAAESIPAKGLFLFKVRY